MRISTIVLPVLLLWSCSRPETLTNKVLLYGHGGAGFDNLNSLYAPNSVGSIQRGLDFYKLDGVEIDVQFTKEGDLIVYHDKYMENMTQCKGRVNSLSIEETTGCIYRTQFQNNYDQEVISFDSFISLYNERWIGKYLNINVQAHFELEYKVDSLASFYHRKMQGYTSLGQVSTECADANFLFFLKKYDSTYSCLLVADIDSAGVEDVYRFELDGIVSSFDKRSDDLEKQLAEDNKKIFLYGHKLTRDYTNYSYQYITGVQVDNPIKAINYFSSD